MSNLTFNTICKRSVIIMLGYLKVMGLKKKRKNWHGMVQHNLLAKCYYRAWLVEGVKLKKKKRKRKEQRKNWTVVPTMLRPTFTKISKKMLFLFQKAE